MLRGKESNLWHTSGGHTGAQVIPPSRLRIRAFLQRPVQIHCRYCRSGDYISGKLWSPCAGDRGTKAQRWEIWWAGGLEAGSERRQASISSKTPTSLWIHAHTAHSETHAKTHVYIGIQQCTQSQSYTCKSKHCPQCDLSGLTGWHAEWRHMGTLRERKEQARRIRKTRGNLLFWSSSELKFGQRSRPLALSINSYSMAGASDGKPGWWVVVVGGGCLRKNDARLGRGLVCGNL